MRRKSMGLAKSHFDWMYSALPFNLAVSPVGTFVQLYILQLNGSVIDIGLAISLFNAASIPAAMIWGYVADRVHTRKTIVVASYVSVAGVLILFIASGTIYGIELLYTVFSFASSAAATPLNLLIMETQPKRKWASAFSHFSVVSGIGTTAGLLLGVGWADFLPLYLFVVPLSVSSLVSAILAFKMIEEPPITLEREMIVMVRRSFTQRLLALPLIFLRIPRALDFRLFFRGIRYQVTREPQILYASIAVFWFASGLFNTSLVPSLIHADVSKSQVFLVSLIATFVQTFSFNYVGPYIEKRNLRDAAVTGLVLRGSCYALFGVSFIFLVGIWYLDSSIVLFSIGSGFGFAAYYAAANVMVFNMLGHSSKGSLLGVYSAIVGFATMLGSFASGFTSFYLGFHVTFFLAAIGLGIAAWLTSTLVSQARAQPDQP